MERDREKRCKTMMKKVSWIPLLMIATSLLVFALAFSQQEQEAGEADSLKADTVKVDTLGVDTLQADTLEADTLKADTLQVDTSEVDTLKADSLEVDTLGVDTLGVDTLEVDTSKAEIPEADTLLADTLKVEKPEADTLLADTLKAETPEADTLLADSLKAEIPEADTIQADTLQADSLEGEAAAQETPKVVVHRYIGTKTCKLCHNSTLKGKIYDVWDSTKHATAYVTLASQQSKTIAEEMGIEDAQQDTSCLKCHVTGFGLPATAKYSMEEGVTCEACHGPGEHYDDIRVMTKPELYEQNGMIKPDEDLCVTCHNQESPTYKPFNYDEAYKLIEHHTPPSPMKK
jgi:pentapeptide MXKDX repeat protein